MDNYEGAEALTCNHRPTPEVLPGIVKLLRTCCPPNIARLVIPIVVLPVE
jgi:hypothetical protein